jgi:hypothetical protein
MNAIKPGTRCGCLECAAKHLNKYGGQGQCPNDAVRMVEVVQYYGRGVNEASVPLYKQVPKCEACATFHEAKEGAK